MISGTCGSCEHFRKGSQNNCAARPEPWPTAFKLTTTVITIDNVGAGMCWSADDPLIIRDCPAWKQKVMPLREVCEYIGKRLAQAIPNSPMCGLEIQELSNIVAASLAHHTPSILSVEYLMEALRVGGVFSSPHLAERNAKALKVLEGIFGK